MEIFGFSLDFLCRFLLPVADTSQVCKSWFFCVTNTTDHQMDISIVIIIITIGTLHALSPCLWPIHGWPRLSALLRVWSQSLSAYWRHRHHRHHHRFHSSDHLVKKRYFDFFLFLCCIALYMGLLGNLKCAQVKSPTVYLYLCNSSNLSSRSFSMLRQQVIFGQTTGAQFTNHKARSIAQ